MTGFNSNDVRYQSLRELDPGLAEAMVGKLSRQRDMLETITSEDSVPRAVLQAQGSVLTNKYAEGYPGRHYYGGCEYIDVVEDMARNRAKELFGAEFTNVQLHAGAQANAAVLHVLINAGDKIIGLDLAHGGHLTHGMKLNFSGKLYHVAVYGVDKDTMRIDMDKVRERAPAEKPDVLIAGQLAYPHHLDFEVFRFIADEVGAKLWTDVTHFAGLVAAGLHPSLVPHSDVVSTTVHKTLGGPRPDIILTKQEYVRKLNSTVFPGQQDGPLIHAIAGKAVTLEITGTEEFKERQERTLTGAHVLAEHLTTSDCAEAGVDVLAGGTDVHLVLADLRSSEMNGQEAEDPLHAVGIIVSRNAAPFNPRPPMVTSELRVGTPTLATCGLGEKTFTEVADVTGTALAAGENADVDSLRVRVSKITQEFLLYDGIEDWNLI